MLVNSNNRVRVDMILKHIYKMVCNTLRFFNIFLSTTFFFNLLFILNGLLESWPRASKYWRHQWKYRIGGPVKNKQILGQVEIRDKKETNGQNDGEFQNA